MRMTATPARPGALERAKIVAAPVVKEFWYMGFIDISFAYSEMSPAAT
jgi:hypothetical protein